MGSHILNGLSLAMADRRAGHPLFLNVADTQAVVGRAATSNLRISLTDEGASAAAEP